jgi:hypothetical protein
VAVSDEGATMVRGMAFLGPIKAIKSVDPNQLERIVGQGGLAVRKVFAQRIRAMSFYPYPAFVAFLRATDRALGSGDLSYCRMLGAKAADADLGTAFSFLLRLYSPELLISSCGQVWRHYCRNGGHMEAISTAPNGTVLRIYDFPHMDPAHCRLMEGWMILAMSRIGTKVLPGARETECTANGGRFHEFRCRWELVDRKSRARQPANEMP